MDTRPKTLFIDIDGTLLFHYGMGIKQAIMPLKVLPGVIEKLDEWDRKNYKIVLITGRKESTRQITENQLQYLGITYDYLVMGIGGGKRVLINDTKPNSIFPTAEAICIERNKGLENLDI